MADVQQAPNMFQNVGNIVAPDLMAQQMQLQRQQQIVNMLRQNAITPIESQTVTGAGPSRVVPISKFQALAKMLEGGMAGYQQKQVDEQNQTLNQGLFDRYQDVSGDLPEGTSANIRAAKLLREQSGGMLDSAAVGANAGGLAGLLRKDTNAQEPTSSPASMGGTSSQSAPQPIPQQPTGMPTSGYVAPHPNFLKGLVAGAMGGPEAEKNYYSQFAPTDATRMANAAGTDPAQANADALKKANYIAPTSLRSDKYLTPDGQLHILPTAAPAGYMNKLDPTTGEWSQVPISGGLDAVKASTEAESTGKTRGTTMMIKLPDGREVPANTGLATDAGNAQAGLTNPAPIPPPQLPTTQQGLDTSKLTPATLQFLNQQDPKAVQAGAADFQSTKQLSANQSGAPTNQPPAPPQLGQSQGKKLLTDQGADILSKTNSEVQNIGSQRQVLNDIWNLVQNPNTKFGPGTDTIAHIKAMASNAGIDMTGAQTDQDVMSKLSSNLVMSTLGQGGTGTDSQMSKITAMFPHGEMTKDAMTKVIPLLVSQLDAKEARSNVAASFAKGNNDLSDLPATISKFSNLADPGTVSLGKKMAAATNNGTLKDFVTNLQKTRPNDWQNLLGKVHQLDSMGAF
jgi:hypothetical protein